MKILPYFIAIGLLLTSCSAVQPNLYQLYRVDDIQFQQPDDNYRQNPVVIIPGIISSELVNEQGKNVWFGPWYKTLFDDFEELELAIDPVTLTAKPSVIKASTLPKAVLGFDFYGSLFNLLEKYGDYKLTELGTPFENNERRYYMFPFDWRYDNTDTIKQLDAVIEQIRKDYNDPTLKVDVIAHSMGGLLARYYMRYGTADVLDDNDFPITQAGAKKVRRLIQLGTPNLGSVAAMHQLMNGYSVVLGTVPVESIVTMPSLYHLLPHPLNDWLITNEGKTLKRDLYDINIWRRFEWGIFDPKVIARIKKHSATEQAGEERFMLLQAYFEKYLERARRFVWSLTIPVPDIEYSIIAFGGNCKPTPARLLVEEVNGESKIRLWPHQVKNKIDGLDYKRLMLEPGDGRVTKPSLLARDSLNPAIPRHEYSFFPLDYAFFLCHDHGQLTGNINFQDNLLNALLERDET